MALEFLPSIPNLDPDDSLPPIPNETLRSSFKVRHAAVLLNPRLVDHIVVDDDFTIAAGQVLALLRGLRYVLTGLTFAVARCTLDILTFN